MPENPPVYYTDTLEALNRFNRVKKKVEDDEKTKDIRSRIPQGHLSGLNADMLDDYHAIDLLREMDDRIARIPRRGHGGGGGGIGYRQVLSVSYFNV